ncbi:hypothetical protein [Streptomyces indicus]|uniref:Uncharacterized protein n=1 Tax=Streptomyces indicus TaxID=417292 RepID=A0A1G8WQG4_9ACTN|nr:hypothetical protein [Streptomyces indicus]SDJ79860.1 hypothetical protein SAMN05421806_102574 [Streptomyces indicus]
MTGHLFPDDLLQAQIDWYATCRQLATASGRDYTLLRRRLLTLSRRIAAHPFWTTPGGASPAARMALKQAAWETAT